jgi:hypothetical protein
LKGDVANLTRKNEELTASLASTNQLFEVLTLSHDELKLANEALDEKCEELTLDCETAQMEVEELKEQLEAGPSSGDLGEASSTADAAKLTKALTLLRSQAAETQKSLTHELRAAQKQAELATTLQTENKSLHAYKTSAAEQIEQLKDQLSTSTSFEEMVSTLTDKNLELEETNQTLVNVNDELEQAAELTAEMEEVQAEELKALQTEISSHLTKIENLNEAIRVQREQHNAQNETIVKYKQLTATMRSDNASLLSQQSSSSSEQSKQLEKSQAILSQAARSAQLMEEMKSKEKQSVLSRISSPAMDMQNRTLQKWLVSELAGVEMAALAGDVVLQNTAGACAVGLELLQSHESENSLAHDCQLAALFVRGNLHATRVLCAIGLNVHNSGDDSMAASSAACHSFSEVHRLATTAVSKIIESDSLNETELHFFNEAIGDAHKAEDIPQQWAPQNFHQLLSANLAANVGLALKRHMGANDKLNKLVAESTRLAEGIGTEECFTRDEGEAFEAAVLKVADAASKETTDVVDALLDEALAILPKQAGGAGENQHPLAPKHVAVFAQCEKYVDSVSASTCWAARGSKIQTKLLDGAKASSRLAEVEADLERSKAQLESKQREIALLGNKVQEFEKLLSDDEVTKGDSKSASASSKSASAADSAALLKLQKENQMLNEAIEVLHGQVDEYESEIKALKSSGGARREREKTPPRRGSVVKEASKGTPVSAAALFAAASSATEEGGEGAMNAGVLAPLLRASRLEVNEWRAKVVVQGAEALAPLPSFGSATTTTTTTTSNQPQDGLFYEGSRSISGCKDELQLARCELRAAKAAVKIVDLSSKGSAFWKVSEERKVTAAAEAKLGTALQNAKAMAVSMRGGYSLAPESDTRGGGGTLAAVIRMGNAGEKIGEKSKRVRVHGDVAELQSLLGYGGLVAAQ